MVPCYFEMLVLGRRANLSIELKKLTAFADPMQLFDELSMIYTICIMCYATLSFSQHRIFRQILGTGLIGLAVFITV